MNQPDKATESLEKYTTINDSLSVEKQKIQDFPVKKSFRKKKSAIRKRIPNCIFSLL
jgi:hypothetical protein